MKPNKSPWLVIALAACLFSFGTLAAQEPQEPTAEPPSEEVAEEVATVAEEPVEQADDEMEATDPPAAQVVEQEPGPTEATETTASSWSKKLAPIGTRLMSGLMSVLKALGVLALFWIAASLLGAGVTKILSMTDLDNKLASGLGLKSILEGEEGSKRSIEGMAGTAVKWIVLLFGFIAFFQYMNLSMVAGPLQNIINQITGIVPDLLYALVILAAYWVVATLLKLVSSKGLQALNFDERAAKYLKPREVKGEIVGPSSMIGRLLFYIVLLLGIPPFLDALGQEALVAPLRDMFTKVFEFVPNIFGAIIIFFVGKIVATIVREVLTNLIAAAGGDELAAKIGIGKDGAGGRLSEIVGSIAFFFIIVLVGIQAVDTLKIDAISVPVRNTLEQLLAAFPPIIGGVIVGAIGYFVAKMVGGLVDSFLSGIGFDQFPEKVGLDFLKPEEGGESLSRIGGQVVTIIILLLIAAQALAMMQLESLAAMVGTLLGYLPNLAVGLVIILAALSLGNYVAGLIGAALSGSAQGGFMASIARYAIYFLGFSMGLTQLGVGEEIVTVAVSAVLGGAALALGIAFGLGGRDKAKEVIEKRSSGF